MKNNNLSQYPNTRMRRLRKTRAIRELVEETSLNVNDLIFPVFITDKNNSENIELMPDIKRLCMNDLMQTAEKLVSHGIHAIALFPVIDKKYKSSNGEEAYKSDGLIQKTIAKLKSEFPELLVITDVALDPYTTHGQDGIIDDNNYVTNDKTIQILKKQALSHAEAGADIVAPSDMMDGRIGAIRAELEKNNFHNTLILSYAAKYASCFYGPFRDAVNSSDSLATGNKYNYQMDPRNSDESLREVALDISEGADIVMIKPAMMYQDIILKIKSEFACPVFAFQVSGEYAMLKAAANAGYLCHKESVMESVLSIKRSGASGIFTYNAIEIAQWLKE